MYAKGRLKIYRGSSSCKHVFSQPVCQPRRALPPDWPLNLPSNGEDMSWQALTMSVPRAESFLLTAWLIHWLYGPFSLPPPITGLWMTLRGGSGPTNCPLLLPLTCIATGRSFKWAVAVKDVSNVLSTPQKTYMYMCSFLSQVTLKRLLFGRVVGIYGIQVLFCVSFP